MTRISWDQFGVPHIEAEDDLSLFRAFGWAQMAGWGAAIIQLIARSRGVAAESWGETWVGSDWWTRSLGIPTRAASWLDLQSESFAACLEAFADGMNQWAAAHPEGLSPEARRQLPVRPVDLIAHAHRVLTLDFLLAQFTDPERAHRRAGSNAWALAPQRTEAGHAMLFAAPHLPWTDAFRWFEAHLVRPGLSLYGATLIGFPVLVTAFNEKLGWTHTANAHSGTTLYELAASDEGYEFDGKVLAFERRDESLLVRRGEEMFRHNWTVLESRHGLVLPVSDRQLALRVVGLDRPCALHQWWRMGCARDLAAFEDALAQMQLPTFSVIYADAKGHVMHLFGGLVPVWPKGQAPPAEAPVPGTRSDLLWTECHQYSELPRVLDPTTGWVHNANDPPWSATIPAALDPRAFPPYFAPRGPMSLRAQWSACRLRDSGRMSLAEMTAAGLSRDVELAGRVLDELLDAARLAADAVTRRAIGILEAWDRTVEASSRGGPLFAEWARRMSDDFFAVSWSEEAPFDTPRGLADPGAAVTTLREACLDLEERFGSAAITWGSVYRMAPAGDELGASGGDIDLGVFCELWFDGAPDNRRLANGGTGFILGVEFSDPPQARALNLRENVASSCSTGERPLQAGFYTDGKLRPVALSPDEIEAVWICREWL